MSKVALRNPTALILWFFAALYGAVTFGLFVSFHRDGPVPGENADVQLWLTTLFLFSGIILGLVALSIPVMTVTARRDGSVTFAWYYPLQWRRLSVGAADMVVPVLVDETDSDGDPSVSISFVLPSGETFRLERGAARHRAMRDLERYFSIIDAARHAQPQD